MKTQSAKAKGRRLQQWFRDLLIEKLDVHPEDIESRSMGAGGEDLLFSPAARRCFPYSVECKNNKSNALYKVMDQAISNCPKGATPLAIIKADHKKPLAVVDADHFFKLAKRNKK